MWNRYRQQPQKQRRWNARLQQRQVQNAHLQRQQQQQQQRQKQAQLLQLERERMEELEREMAEQRLPSFLETDNSFLTPWNWNPDAPSTSHPMAIERDGSFFSHNQGCSTEDQISENLSAIHGKQDYPDNKDMEQVSKALLDQNLRRTNVGTEHEKSEDLSGTKGTSVEVSSEFNVDQIAKQASNALSEKKISSSKPASCTTTTNKPEIPQPPRNKHTVPRVNVDFEGKSMAEEKKQPKFSKILELRPMVQGLNLLVKVVDTKMIKMRNFAESLVGDETGMIVFTARGNQIDLMKEGATLILYNAKIEMFKGSMRLAVDKRGRIRATEPATFSVKEDNNLSLIEFEEIRVRV